MEVGIILGAIALIVVWYFVAAEFRRIAGMKGHGESRYFWWSFLLGLVGRLMVVALPDRADEKASANVPNDELPEL